MNSSFLDDPELAWAWAAGLFEGEGSIIHWKAKRTPEQGPGGWWHRGLTLSMTDKDMVERFQKIVGVGNIKLRPRGKHKLQYEWKCSKWALTKPTLERLLPFLGERRRLAAEALLENPANPHPGPMPLSHCKRGHEYTPKNSYYAPKDGRRSCRACQAILGEKNRERKRNALSVG